MRVAVLAGSDYSERALAVILALGRAGFTPVACLCRSTDTRSLVRKVTEQGAGDFLRYALRRVGLSSSGSGGGASMERFGNPWIRELLEDHHSPPSRVSEACEVEAIPLMFCRDVNSAAARDFLRSETPDLLVYTGGGILRGPLIALPTVGVLNAHAGALPRYRGMNTAEWSLLHGDPPAITAHLMDTGIDTGPILFVRKNALDSDVRTLQQLRHFMTAESVRVLVEAVRALAEREVRPREQRPEAGKQYFVVHDSLLPVAEARLRERIRFGSR